MGITSTDDAVWFTEILAGRIGTIGADGVVVEHPLPDPDARPHAITATPQGCWFTEWATGRVGRITPDGAVTTYPLPDTVSEPHGIAVGDGDALWVACESGSLVRVG